MDDLTARLAALGVELPEVEAYERLGAPDTALDGAIGMSKADAALAAVVGALEKACSWEGVLDFIDRVYPAEVFTGESGDPGPRLIVLLRKLKKVEAELARLTTSEAALAEQTRIAYGAQLEAEEELSEVAGRPRQQVTDLKRIVGEQEQELEEAKYRIREMRAENARLAAILGDYAGEDEVTP